MSQEQSLASYLHAAQALLQGVEKAEVAETAEVDSNAH
jgi:hypothetical protein